MGNLPADACPYPRPFPEGFRECPTFVRGTRISASAHRPLLMTGSCVNLTVGSYLDEIRHHYGRCSLGDSAARLAQLKDQIMGSDAYVSSHSEADGLTLTPPPVMPPR